MLKVFVSGAPNALNCEQQPEVIVEFKPGSGILATSPLNLASTSEEVPDVSFFPDQAFSLCPTFDGLPERARARRLRSYYFIEIIQRDTRGVIGTV